MATAFTITAILAIMIGLGLLAWVAFGLGVMLEKEWLVHVGGITAIFLVVTLAGGLIWGGIEGFLFALSY